MNLLAKMSEQLPHKIIEFVKCAGQMAQEQGQGLYLVGGMVRDLLLGRSNLDIDLVVEGNALKLSQALAEVYQGKILAKSQFGTVKVRLNSWEIDLAMARSEKYAKPGALPTVSPGDIRSDLFRRDFTINAMAIELNPGRYGRLLDLFGGREDLEKKLIRILHKKSFVDDATRIWRAIRYEQRLDFHIEPVTLDLLRSYVPMLDTISGNRIRHELELVLKEALPEKALRRAEELGVLAKVLPSLKADSWLAERFEQARALSSPGSPSAWLYLALLAYHLNDKEIEQLISYLKLPKLTTQILRDTINLKSELSPLNDPNLARSAIYFMLHKYNPVAVLANQISSDSPVIKKHLQLFLTSLRNMKPSLNGEDLKRMGVSEGPRIKEMLKKLQEARLDGKVSTRREEEEMVRRWNLLKT